jgi:hypothetical protein
MDTRVIGGQKEQNRRETPLQSCTCLIKRYRCAHRRLYCEVQTIVDVTSYELLALGARPRSDFTWDAQIASMDLPTPVIYVEPIDAEGSNGEGR